MSPTGRNPLTTTVLIVVISEAISLKRWWTTRTQPDLLAALTLVHAVVLTTLYLRRSPAAGAFLFWSLLPIYPLYFGFVNAGWMIRQPGVTYVILLVIWAVGMTMVWREKRRYEQWIAPLAATQRDPAEPLG